jgi:hypothetical protein
LPRHTGQNKRARACKLDKGGGAVSRREKGRAPGDGDGACRRPPCHHGCAGVDMTKIGGSRVTYGQGRPGRPAPAGSSSSSSCVMCQSICEIVKRVQVAATNAGARRCRGTCIFAIFLCVFSIRFHCPAGQRTRPHKMTLPWDKRKLCFGSRGVASSRPGVS